MKKNTKHSRFLLLLCALICALSVGLVGCASSTPSESSLEESNLSIDGSIPSIEPDDPEEPNPEEPEEQMLFIVAPTEEVYPYIQDVRSYLEAGPGANVSNYYHPVATQAAPVQIKWKYNAEGARKFIIEYATKQDFSDALSVEASAAKRSVDIYNLYKSSTYHVRVTAVDTQGNILHTAVGAFETTELGPRFMYVDDVRNLRDIGGYITEDGHVLAQGIAYRGGSPTAPPGNVHYLNNITEDGRKYMSEVMGIKTEIDFRNANEAGITLEQGSVIPGATLHYLTLSGYESLLSNYNKQMRDLFAILSQPESYPVYMHCTGGADRTGSVIFLLEAILGVSEEQCIQDYELTTFSTYGTRNTQAGEYKDYFQPFLTKLKTYGGDTLQENAENWAFSIGISQEEIDAVKAIFYGEIEVGGYFPNNAESSAYSLGRSDDGSTFSSTPWAIFETGKLKVAGAHTTTKSGLYLLPVDSTIKFPIEDWNAPFSYSSGNGITLNGEMINMHNSVKSAPGSFYVGLGRDAEKGDIVKIEGTFDCEAHEMSYVIEECSFIWNGSSWEDYTGDLEGGEEGGEGGEDDEDLSAYNLIELGTLTTTFYSVSQPAANRLYMKAADGTLLGEFNNLYFAYKSGTGILVNGQPVAGLTQFKHGPGGSNKDGENFFRLYLDNISALNSGAGVVAGDIITIGGTFVNDDVLAAYTIEDSSFIWDGSTWSPLNITVDGTEYVVTSIGANNDSSAKIAYIYSKGGNSLPKDKGNWQDVYDFVAGSGDGLTLNGVKITASGIKMPGDLYIPLSVEAKIGEILVIDGSFYNANTAIKLTFVKCALKWNGSTWETCSAPLNYTVHELGALKFSKVTQTNNNPPIPNGYLYLKRADGEQIPIYSKENDMHWSLVFCWDADSITINGEAVTATVKFPSEMFIAFKAEPKEGDVLRICGEFYNDDILTKYIIEETVFEWDGTSWIPYVEYNEHELGQLRPIGAPSTSVLNLERADGEEFAVNDLSKDFTFFGGSGIGITLNGEVINVTTLKTSATELIINLGLAVKEGDVIRISGAFYNVSTKVRYIIEENAFIYEDGAWKNYVSTYNELGLGNVTPFDDASTEKFIYLFPADTSLVLPVDSWNDADLFTVAFGEGVKLNGKTLESAKVRSIDSTVFVSLGLSAKVGYVLTIGGKFVCEAQSTLYFIKDRTFIWNGEAWQDASSIEISTAKASAMSALNAYLNATDYRPAEQAEIAEILASAQSALESFSTLDSISQVLEIAYNSLDALKTNATYEKEELLDAKALAEAEIRAYHSAIDFSLYTRENGNVIRGYVKAALTDVRAAEALDNLADIVDQLKAQVANVEQGGDVIESTTDAPASSGGCGASAEAPLFATLLAFAGVMLIRKKKEA